MPITKVTIGRAEVWIPASWDRFLHKGYLYVRDGSGRFISDRAWSKVA